MDLGLIGQGLSGKTTVFNAVTRGHSSTGTVGVLEPSIGVVKRSDDRLERLCAIIKPKKQTYTEYRYLDFPGGLSVRGEGPAAAHLEALAQCDALVQVVRAFHDEAVPHPEQSVDPDRDITAVNLEFMFVDAALLERRFEKLETAVRSGRPGEREAGERELALVQRLRESLEGEQPLRTQVLSPDEERLISGFQLFTNKPFLIAVNVDEADASRVSEIGAEFATRWAGPGVSVAALCGKLEQELSELSDEDAEEFRKEMGLEAGGPQRMLELSQQVLGLITFFTIGDTEGRAWALAEGSTALEAAGKIHTDIERGFIRAEVIGAEDFVRCGSHAEARKQGLLRTEGKQYVVQDGDVLNVLFNV